MLLAKLCPCLSTGSAGKWQHHSQKVPFQKLAWNERGREEASAPCPLGLRSVICGDIDTHLCIPCGLTPLALPIFGQTRFISGKPLAPPGRLLSAKTWKTCNSCWVGGFGLPAGRNKRILLTIVLDQRYMHVCSVTKSCLTLCDPTDCSLGVPEPIKHTSCPEVRVWVGQSCKLTYQRWQFSCAKCCDGEKSLACLCAQQRGDRWPRAGVIWEQERVPYRGRNIKD